MPEAAEGTSAIRPFRINVPDEKLVDLRRRITATQWPERETVNDSSQGVQFTTIQNLARYWATEYDWRKVEARLNALPQFITEIDGLDIHFIHVRSKHENALPMIVTHGWPGSIIEQMKIIGPLTDPTAHGGSASDAFHLVIPSLPGYGFSGKPTAPGWNPVSIARAWATLMQRLGYTRYVAQGGDWGNAVSEVMALQQPPGLLGIHTNMAATVPANISKALAFHETPPADLTAEERNAWEQLVDFYGKGLGYALEMSNRPQTLYGIADSPVGLAAWMIDHDIRSYLMIARVFNGQTEGLTRDDILDNVTLYWLTNTAISSARLYWDTTQVSTGGGFFDVRGVKLPVAVSVFPDEIYAAPRSWAEKAYPRLIHYNKLEKGTHFAAWEQPEFFTSEMRAAFKSLRKPS
jgi:pimeloyl-ACP methyl ester carboxylesterase